MSKFDLTGTPKKFPELTSEECFLLMDECSADVGPEPAESWPFLLSWIEKNHGAEKRVAFENRCGNAPM